MILDILGIIRTISKHCWQLVWLGLSWPICLSPEKTPVETSYPKPIMVPLEIWWDLKTSMNGFGTWDVVLLPCWVYRGSKTWLGSGRSVSKWVFNGETGLRLGRSWHIFCKNLFVLQISLCQGRMDDSPHVIFQYIPCDFCVLSQPVLAREVRFHSATAARCSSQRA